MSELKVKLFINDLIFSLNATIPIFLMMILGYILKKINLLDEASSKKINQFSFRILLPALLFMDLSTADFLGIWDTKYVTFCFAVTVVSIIISVFLSLFDSNKSERGEFIQASFRSSAAVLGIAFVNNIYGDSKMAALMIIATVPLYNIISVIVLSITSPENQKDISPKKLFFKTFKDIAKNPIIIGIAAGIIWSLLKIPQPVILSKSISYLGNMASPLSLISLGALFNISDAKSKFSISAFITFIKLILFCAIFLPISIWLGFTDEKLISILVMLGSATTGSCFVMAKNMGHKGTITSCSVMLTTFFSSITLTLWLFLIKSFGYI